MTEPTIKLEILLSFLILSATTALPAQEIDQQLQAYLSEQVQSQHIPGLTAAVVQDGQVLFSDAFGGQELGKKELLTPEHIFHFASVSKPFVATAIVQLVEQGKMDLGDPVTKYLPYFQLADERYHDITILQMLNHTSGMPDVTDYEWNKPQYDEGAAERYVRQIASKKLLWAPGSDWQYSNMAFDALGDVIAKVSGISFEEYIKKNIFEPLGMEKSSFIYPDIEEQLRTTGHIGEPAKVSKVYPYNRRHAPSSTLNSSVNQMTRWMLANLNKGELNGKRILSSDSYELLMRPTAEIPKHNLQIGLSWFLKDYKGHRTVNHSGGDTGFASYLLLLPDDNIGIVLACNWNRVDLNAIAYGMLDLILASKTNE